MKFLPAGADNKRLVLLLALLGLAVFFWYYRSGSTEAVPLSALSAAAGRTPAPVTTQPRDPGTARGNVRQTSAPQPTVPQALKLAELEQVPNEPDAGRNPFLFGVKPPPPAPPQPAYTPPVYTPPPAPPPPPPPEVKLVLKLVVDGPDGKKRAYLVDPTGAMFEGVDGQIIDGRYRLVKVERTSAIVEFLDGTGRKTLFLR
jgi:hypothetical protein